MQNNKIKYGQYYASTEIKDLDLTEIDEIEESACASSSIEQIKGTVKNVRNFAFSVCEKLKGTIKVGGEKVGRAAFERCPMIEKVVLEEDVEYIDGWAFDECENLTQLTLPQMLKTIGEEAFHRTGIETLSIGEVGSIKENAFSECSKLKTITIQKINESIKSNAFSKCSNLKNITYNGKTLMNLNENQRFKGIDVQDDGVYIKYEENGNIATIKLPKDIPFERRDEELKMEPLKPEGEVTIDQKEVPEGMLRECKTITGVTLDSVEKIGNNAFDKCSNLKKVELAPSVRKIGRCAFQDSGIEKIDLRNTRYNSYTR